MSDSPQTIARRIAEVYLSHAEVDPLGELTYRVDPLAFAADLRSICGMNADQADAVRILLDHLPDPVIALKSAIAGGL